MTQAATLGLHRVKQSKLRRLKLTSLRRVAPELLVTAKTQRSAPVELRRALVEVEITARDAQPYAAMQQAGVLLMLDR